MAIPLSESVIKVDKPTILFNIYRMKIINSTKLVLIKIYTKLEPYLLDKKVSNQHFWRAFIHKIFHRDHFSLMQNVL